jgi:hypothetical protein
MALESTSAGPNGISAFGLGGGYEGSDRYYNGAERVKDRVDDLAKVTQSSGCQTRELIQNIQLTTLQQQNTALQIQLSQQTTQIAMTNGFNAITTAQQACCTNNSSGFAALTNAIAAQTASQNTANAALLAAIAALPH